MLIMKFSSLPSAPVTLAVNYECAFCSCKYGSENQVNTIARVLP